MTTCVRNRWTHCALADAVLDSSLVCRALLPHRRLRPAAALILALGLVDADIAVEERDKYMRCEMDPASVHAHALWPAPCNSPAVGLAADAAGERVHSGRTDGEAQCHYQQASHDACRCHALSVCDVHGEMLCWSRGVLFGGGGTGAAARVIERKTSTRCPRGD